MDELRTQEIASLRAFMLKHAPLLRGRVMDFGAGKQPYRDLVSDGAEYIPIEKEDCCPNTVFRDRVSALRFSGAFDAIMCTQVLQYIQNPVWLLSQFAQLLQPEGRILLTYPTNWPEVEADDLHRFTRAGMEAMLREVRLEATHHEERFAIQAAGNRFVIGYGLVARRYR